MSDHLQTQMLNAWKWTEPISFDIFVKFMYQNYKFEYEGLEYDPDFGKLVRNLDREQVVINDKQRAAFFARRAGELNKMYEK